MASTPEREPVEHEDGPEQRRWQQYIYDDIVLLLVLGLVVPTIFYIALGLLDLTSVPSFQP